MVELKDYQKTAKAEFEKRYKFLEYPETIKALAENPTGVKEQQEAVEGRVDPFNILIDAPTGSGKTVLAANIIKDNFKDHIVFWFSPGAGDLEEQSARSLRCVLGGSGVERMDESTFNFAPSPGTVYIGNWEQFVTKDKKTKKYKNRVARDGDDRNFWDMVSKISVSYMPVVIVIDEAHHGSGKHKGAILDFLEDIEATLGYSPFQVHVSATPVIDSAQKVIIPIKDVVAEGMIRKEVLLNSSELIERANSLSDEERNSEAIEPLMTNYALDLLDRIDMEYRKVDAHELVAGKKVYYHGLVGIQVPNGKVGNDLIARMEALLRERVDIEGNHDPITVDNGQLVIYLSDKKDGSMDNIESPASAARVLIYKQGISTGWDCPRAQILLGFRHITSHVFTKQNLGRFVRTTQAKHYGNEILDRAYVVSNVGDLGQAEFSKEENKSGFDVREAVSLRVLEDNHVALSTFNNVDIPVSHYAAINQTTIPLKTVARLTVEHANESKLWEKLAYVEPRVNVDRIVAASDDMVDGFTGFEEVGVSGAIQLSADVLAEYANNVFTGFIRETQKTFRNDNQVARSMVKSLVSWYKQAVLNTAVTTLDDSHLRLPMKDHFGTLNAVDTEVNETNPDWSRVALEQLMFVDEHRNAIEALVQSIVHDKRAKASNVDIERNGEKLQASADREFIEDGVFILDTTQSFYVAKNANEDDMVPVSLKDYTALDSRVHEGAALSTPERETQNEFFPKLVNGDNYTLATFYKSPENARGAFARGVKITDSAVTNFYPDWLLELKNSEGVYIPAIIETKSATEVNEAKSDPTHPTYAKATDLIMLVGECDGLRAGIVYHDPAGDWRVITGVDDNGGLVSTDAVQYFTAE